MRYPEIDFVRGIGLGLMVLYHAAFDYHFFIQPIQGFGDWPWLVLARTAAVLFVSLAGLSVVLFYQRPTTDKKKQHTQTFFRGLKIFGIGMGITLATHLIFPTYAIWYGVLHLIGTCVALSFIADGRFRIQLGGGILLTAAGILLSLPGINTLLPFFPVLLPIALQSFDYFPLLPWAGVFLLGMAAGTILFPGGKPRYSLEIKNSPTWFNGMAWLGKNTLLIYLIHQPVLAGIILFLHAARLL